MPAPARCAAISRRTDPGRPAAGRPARSPRRCRPAPAARAPPPAQPPATSPYPADQAGLSTTTAPGTSTAAAPATSTTSPAPPARKQRHPPVRQPPPTNLDQRLRPAQATALPRGQQYPGHPRLHAIKATDEPAAHHVNRRGRAGASERSTGSLVARGPGRVRLVPPAPVPRRRARGRVPGDLDGRGRIGGIDGDRRTTACSVRALHLHHEGDALARLQLPGRLAHREVR